LQVEHPVTEEVTGLDLVEQQLLVASGRELAFTQDDVALRGHSIEVRVCAEDPATGFLPSTGTILDYREPAGSGVRVDGGIRRGSEVTPYYDSLLVKVIATGEDREEALERLGHALDELRLLGLPTNAGYLRRLLALAAVRAGELDTGLIGRLDPVTPPFSDEEVARAAAAHAIAEPHSDDPFARTDGWRLGGVRAPSYWTLSVDGGAPIDVVLDEQKGSDPFRSWVAADGWIGRDGWSWQVTRPTAEDVGAAHGDGDLRAPMPGQVLLVNHGEGDEVQAGDAVVVLESMKMELSLVAPVAGRVTGLSVEVGDMVTRDQVVATVEAA
jgi:acetyl-CoA/propionyl-CoA carboxylase biotin carboxyl carrier protein